MILKSWSRGHLVKLALLIAVPLGIYWMLAAQMSWRPRTLIDLHKQASVQSLSLSPDGKRIVVFSDGRLPRVKPRVSVWTRDGGLMWQSDMPTTSVFSLHDGTMLSTSVDNATITLRNERTGRVQKTWVVNDPFFFVEVLSPDEKFLVCSSGQAALRVYDISRIARNRPSVVHQFPQGWGIRPPAFSPDSRILALAVQRVDGHGQPVYEIQLWKTQPWELQRTIKTTSGGVIAFSFSPDGKVLAGVGMGRKMWLWNPQTGKSLRPIATAAPYFVFSPDQKMLAASHVRKIRLWDVRTGALLRDLVDDNHFMNPIVFAPDGTTLLSGNEDGTVRQWRIK